jgi:hypothetical protein
MKEDINNGWVWVAKPEVARRTVVCITNRENHKSIYCEALSIDTNFVRAYNQGDRYQITDPANSIVLNEWYRTHLGDLRTQVDYDLNVENAEHLVGRLRSCIHHPQIVVRIAAWISLLSLLLGVIGIALGALSFK